MYNVKNHYYEILKGISGNKILKYENDFLQYSASLAKFNDEKADIISILDNNRDEIVAFLNNSYLSFVKSMSDKDKLIGKFSVLERKDVSVYCNDITMLQCIDGIAIDNVIKEKYGEKNEDITDIFKERKIAFLNTAIANLEIFKIAIVNKYFYKNKYLEASRLLKDTEKSCKIPIDKLKEEIKLYECNFNEDMIFQPFSTTKKLYQNILDKLDTDNYKFKLEEKIEIVENLNREFEFIKEKKQTDKENKGNYVIGILGLFFTIIFGFNAIEYFVNNFLIKFELDIIKNHPFRVAVFIWILSIFLAIIITRKFFWKKY